MKLFGIFAFASVAMAQFGDYDLDALGNKKPSAVDKGPRECNGHKLSDSMDKSKLWKCTSRNPDNKNPHLTKVSFSRYCQYHIDELSYSVDVHCSECDNQ